MRDVSNLMNLMLVRQERNGRIRTLLRKLMKIRRLLECNVNCIRKKGKMIMIMKMTIVGEI